MKEYLDDQTKGNTSKQSPDFKITDGERTYSAFLPKADLNQIISTAISQQSQTGKNFGVVTINPPTGCNIFIPILNCKAIPFT